MGGNSKHLLRNSKNRSALSKGNEAFRSGRYEEAIALYRLAIVEDPALVNFLDFNIALAESRHSGNFLRYYQLRKESSRIISKLPITVLVIGDYNLIQTHLPVKSIGRLVQRLTLLGFSTTQYLENKWEFAEEDMLPPVIPLRVGSESDLLNSFERITSRFKPDVVIALKPHLPSIELGSMFKDRYGIPFIVEEESNPILWEVALDQLTDRKLESDINPLVKFWSSFAPIHQHQSQPRAAPKLGKDIVVFWKQNDTGLYGRRSDMIVRYLASRTDVRKIIVLDAPMSYLDLESCKSGRQLTHDRKIYVKTYQKVLGQLDTEKVSFDVFIYDYDSGAAYGDSARAAVSPEYLEFINAVLQREGVDSKKAIFWFYPKNFFSSDIIKAFQPHKIVVDVVDDHRAWPGVSLEEKRRLTEHYRDMLQHADMAFANCQPVMDAMKEFNPRVQLVPNGCEGEPKVQEPINNPIYNELKQFQGKVLGFVGNLEAKIDIPLIERLAVSFSDALVVLAGSTHANPAARDLARFPNVRMLGAVDYKFINAIVSTFSVGLVPHKKMALTENMNPLKVFIYLSNRVPVVSTDISNIPTCDAVFIAANHTEFIEKCRLVLSGEVTISGFDNFIQENNWERRLSTHIDNLISSCQ